MIPAARERRTESRTLLIAGLLLIAAGLAANEWLLAALFSEDGAVALEHRALIWLFDVSMVLAGALLVGVRKRLDRRKLALAFLALIAGLVLAELGLRVAEGLGPKLMIATGNPNGTGSYRIRAGLDIEFPYHGTKVPIRTNSHGMRWREVSHENTAGRQRVAFAGDSFTFGESADRIEDSFVGVFDSLVPADLEVLNFGVVGYGFDDIELQFREQVRPFHPAWLILVSFNGNDIRDTFLGLDKFAIVDGLLELDRQVLAEKVPPQYRAPRESTFKFSFMTNLRLYRIFARTVSMFRDREEGDPEPFHVSDDFVKFSFWSRSTYPPVAVSAVERSLETLSRLKTLCDESSVTLLLVTLPYREQVYAPSITGTDPLGEPYDLGLPQRFVTDWAERHGVPCLDLLPAMRARAAEAGLELYARNDVHLNNRGHLLVGRLILEFFESLRGGRPVR